MRGPSRPSTGNLLALLCLAVIAGLLLRLHLHDAGWSVAATRTQWTWAGLCVLVYLALCLLICWRGRRRDSPEAPGQSPVLVAWASQTGLALTLANRTADALRSAGVPAHVRSLHQLDGALLQRTARVLFIASTTGEGDAPDHALPFLRRVMPADLRLDALHYAVLALGDRSYGHFCAFGHQLDAWLRQHGAHALFDTVEVDNADAASLRHWQQLLGQLGGDASEGPDWSPAQYQPWTLLERTHLNPGSAGGAVFWLRLQAPPTLQPQWQAGDIAEIGPRHAPATVDAWLRMHGREGDTALVDGRPLSDHLTGAHLPDAAPGTFREVSAEMLVDQLEPLPHREYSIASVMADGALELVVRRQRRADGGPGIGSGWLCDHLQPGQAQALRVRSNPNFHGVSPSAPLILIGNGTGIAALRAHLRERAPVENQRTWLLFGERSAAHDFHFGDELLALQRQGRLQLDTVFSRDGGTHRYVQHRLLAEAARLRAWVDDGATILVCGSLQGMAPAVDAVIETVLGAELREAMLASGRYRRDVY